MSLSEGLSNQTFKFVHGNFLVFNTCWEDPRLDRVALELGPADRVLAITSAGCNVLDYALCGPREIHAVDINPRQNALLELKLSGIRNLDHDQFFQMFGRGWLPDYQSVYRRLRSDLPEAAQRYWDQKIGAFSGRGWRGSFYYHGAAGTAARLFRSFADWCGLENAVHDLLACRTVAEQAEIFERHIRPWLRRPGVRWILSRDFTLAMLGTPRVQRQQLERYYHGGLPRFVEDCLEAVLARLPLADNYFWRVYLAGEYSPECCPEYLKPENFARLKRGLAERIQVHTCSVLDFLRDYRGRLSRFVLLDHMDWLSAAGYPTLCQQWQAILEKAAPRARIIWRSGGLKTEFVDAVQVTAAGRRRPLGEILSYHRELAEKLHAVDRAHTYGSFHIADLLATAGPAIPRPHFQTAPGAMAVGVRTGSPRADAA